MVIWGVRCVSEVSLVELEESRSDYEKLALKQPGSLSVNHSPKQSFKSVSPTPKYMQTLRKSILTTFQRWTYSPEDSPVKTLARQESGLVLQGVDLHSGNITAKPLGFYDPKSQLLRTFKHSLIEDSAQSLQTLPRSGMMRNGIVYQLPPLVRITKGTASSSWPTPTTKGLDGGSNSRKAAHARQRWPTPRANDAEKRGNIAEDPRNGLPAAVKYNTPRAQDWKQSSDNPAFFEKHKDRTQLPFQVGGRLNPIWTEWLMGFPEGWTAISGSNASKLWETLSSRQLQKRSAKPSRKRMAK